jgi:hypothetical protein
VPSTEHKAINTHVPRSQGHFPCCLFPSHWQNMIQKWAGSPFICKSSISQIMMWNSRAETWQQLNEWKWKELWHWSRHQNHREWNQPGVMVAHLTATLYLLTMDNQNISVSRVQLQLEWQALLHSVNQLSKLCKFCQQYICYEWMKMPLSSPRETSRKVWLKSYSRQIMFS